MRLFVDMPAPNAALTAPITVGGWAVDVSSTSGSGVDMVHVYAIPASGGSPTFLGAATFGNRADVAAAYGAQFLTSGLGTGSPASGAAGTTIRTQIDPTSIFG